MKVKDMPNPPIMPAFSYKGKRYYDANCKDPYVEGVERYRERSNEMNEPKSMSQTYKEVDELMETMQPYNYAKFMEIDIKLKKMAEPMLDEMKELKKVEAVQRYIYLKRQSDYIERNRLVYGGR